MKTASLGFRGVGAQMHKGVVQDVSCNMPFLDPHRPWMSLFRDVPQENIGQTPSKGDI